jgi:hypothetical protein
LGFRPLAAVGVRGVAPLDKVPFVFCDAFVVVRVDDGVLAVREGDSSEGVAVAQPAIEKDK